MSLSNTSGLSQETISKICGVFSRFPEIDEAILYGSRAKGNYREGSDIDLTLQGDALSLELLLKVMTEIDDLMLPYKFDLSIHKHINDKPLLEHIQRVGKIFYRKHT